jgi:glycosyl transferase family 25
LSTWEILVVSLPKDTDRRARVTEMFNGTDFKWQFIYADEQERQQLDYQEKMAINHRGRALLTGELGCYASHLKCWNYLSNQKDLDYVLVMEDDVLLDKDFDFERMVKFMQYSEITYLRLYSRSMTSVVLLGNIDHRRVYRFRHNAFGTQCYLISRAGADKMVAASRKGIYRPVDDEMDRFWSNEVPNLAIFPYPVMELNAKSTIRSSLTATNVSGFNQLCYKLNTKIDNLNKKIANVRLKSFDKHMSNQINLFNKNAK